MKVLLTNFKEDLTVEVSSFANETKDRNSFVIIEVSNESDITTLCKLFKKEVLFTLPYGKKSIEITFNVDSIKIYT